LALLVIALTLFLIASAWRKYAAPENELHRAAYWLGAELNLLRQQAMKRYAMYGADFDYTPGHEGFQRIRFRFSRHNVKGGIVLWGAPESLPAHIHFGDETGRLTPPKTIKFTKTGRVRTGDFDFLVRDDRVPGTVYRVFARNVLLGVVTVREEENRL